MPRKDPNGEEAKAWAKEYWSRPENAIKKRERSKRWRQSARGKAMMKANKKRWHERHPEAYREKDWRQAGFDLTKARAIYARGKCDVCGRADVKLCLDHDHKTNKVRGLLCDLHNRVLGLANDDPILLMNFIKYLENSSN